MFVCRRLQIRSLVNIWSSIITWAVCQSSPLSCRCVTVKTSTSTLRSVNTTHCQHAPWPLIDTLTADRHTDLWSDQHPWSTHWPLIDTLTADRHTDRWSTHWPLIDTLTPDRSEAVITSGVTVLFQCRAVSKRLAMAEKSREALTEELKLAHQNITRLQVRHRSPDSVCGVVFIWHALLCFRTSSAPPRGAMKISWAWWATTCAAWMTRSASSATRSTRSSSPPRSDPSASAHLASLFVKAATSYILVNITLQYYSNPVLTHSTV